MKYKINESGCRKMLFMLLFAAFLLFLDPKSKLKQETKLNGKHF